MYLKKLHILLLWWEKFYERQSDAMLLFNHQCGDCSNQQFHNLVDFCVLLQSITEDGQVSSYNCGFIHFFFSSLSFCFMLGLYCLVHVLRIVFLVKWSLYHYTMYLFVPGHFICSEVYLNTTIGHNNSVFFFFLKMCSW